MTSARERTIRCTVHWFDDEQAQMRDIAFADRPAGELAATLRDCLDGRAHRGAAQLRHAPLLPAWPVNKTLADLGVRDGSHVWFVPDPPASTLPVPLQAERHYRCALVLPHGQEVPLPAHGQDVGRVWLLHQMRPWRRAWEWVRSVLLRSPYDQVADEAHCYLRPLSNGDWALGTTYVRWPTVHNNTPLLLGLTRTLISGDHVVLGERLQLRIVLRPCEDAPPHHLKLAACPYGRLEVLTGKHCAQHWAVQPDLTLGAAGCAAQLSDAVMDGVCLVFDRDAHGQTVVVNAGATPVHVYRPTAHGMEITYRVYALTAKPFALRSDDLLVVGDLQHAGNERYGVQIRFEHPYF